MRFGSDDVRPPLRAAFCSQGAISSTYTSTNIWRFPARQGGTPKWGVYKGNPIKIDYLECTPIYGNPHIAISGIMLRIVQRCMFREEQQPGVDLKTYVPRTSISILQQPLSSMHSIYVVYVLFHSNQQVKTAKDTDMVYTVHQHEILRYENSWIPR